MSPIRPTLPGVAETFAPILVPGEPAVVRGPFDPVVLAADIRLVATLFTEELGRVREGAWAHRSGRSADAWTVHDIVGHMATIAESANATAAAALAAAAVPPPGLPEHGAVAAWNRERVDRTRGQPTIITVDRLLGALEAAAEFAEALSPGDAARSIRIPTYDRPVRVDEALSVQVSHSLVAHGAQLAAATGLEPPWAHLGPDPRHRVLERLFQQMTVLYDPARGGELRALVAFEIGGAGGGAWWLAIAPEEVRAGRGAVARPTVTFRIVNTSVAFLLFSHRLNLPLALLRRRLRLVGDLGLAMRFPQLVDAG